jgi:DNA primase
MIDTSHVDLVALAGVPLKKRGRQLVGACPMCGGTDRFFVDPDKGVWGCRRCTDGSYRDALHLVSMMHGLDLKTGDGFRAACDLIQVQPPDRGQQKRTPRSVPNTAPALRPDYASYSKDWQSKANEFVGLAAENMLTAHDAREYLAGRGILSDVVSGREIGYNPAPYQATWGDVEVYMPPGIVIPWEMHSLFTYSRIRVRTNGNPKYQQAAGASNGLFYVGRVLPSSYVVLCEGELDALSLKSELIRHARSTGNYGVNRVVPVATGGTTQGRVMRHVVELSLAKSVLIAFDNDENGAGDSGAQWWLDRLDNAHRWRPTAHDVNDMVMSDGAKVVDWLREGFSNAKPQKSTV